MSSELKEIQRKVREAAERNKILEQQQKEKIKKNSAESALEDKKKLDAALHKKSRNYATYFIVPIAILASICFGFMLWQCYAIYSPKEKTWEKPFTTPKDLASIKDFLTDSLQKAKSGKNIDNIIAPNIPQTWKTAIIENFHATKNDAWLVTTVSVDEFKKGSQALFHSTQTNSKQHFKLSIIKDGDRFFLMRTSKMEENPDEKP
jgi:hypothetical protein